MAGAVIATPSATLRAQQTQQQVLASLSAWQNRADDERIATIRAVAAQIRSLRIVGRQFVSLDPDAVRTDARGDRFLEGRYDLWLSPAPRTVTLMGAVVTPGKRPRDRAQASGTTYRGSCGWPAPTGIT